MTKHIYAKTVLCFLLIILCPCNDRVLSQQADNGLAKSVGRNDPFAQFAQRQKPVAPSKISATMSIEEFKPELFIETITLKFLDATTLKIVIESMLSEYGNVTANQKRNSLIACDTKDNLNKIMTEIKKADKQPQQLLIEAVILDVQLDDKTEIGVNWDILSDRMYDISYRQNLGARLSAVGATSTTRADTTAFNTTSDTGTEGGYFALISGTIRNVIHLLQEKKDIEILASPQVMVLSGESASIETVTELPYREITETSGAGLLSTTQFKSVGVKLNVTATLIDNNYILVTVEPEQSVNTGEFGTTSEIPIIDTRKAKTTLLLKDGEVVVMGGLRRKETTNQVSKIPLLGDLPLIGVLFRNTKKVVKNSELLVLLSPHIHKGEPIPEEVMAKFREIKDRPMLSIPEDKNATREKLLKKIKMLQNRNKDVAGELSVALTELERDLDKEIQSTLKPSQ